MSNRVELYAGRFPVRFILRNAGLVQTPKVSVVNLGQPLVDPSINAHPVFKRMLSGSVVKISPDGRGIYTYTDNFLRYYRWRVQKTDARGIEDLRKEDVSQPIPKVLHDLYSFKGRDLFFNAEQDGLWWTGEITYRFQSIGGFRSFQLGDPDPGKPTLIGDWGGQKGGRAVHIFASLDGRKWLLIWRSARSSPPRMTAYQVYNRGSHLKVELPPELLGKNTIYIKFRGECQNLLAHLFVRAEFDAANVKLPVIRSGRNEIVYDTDASPGQRAVVVLDDLEGVELAGQKVGLSKKHVSGPEVITRRDCIQINFPNNALVRIAKHGRVIKGIDQIISQARVILEKDELHQDLGLRIKTLKNGNISTMEYTGCIYTGWEKKRDTVVIHTLLKSKSPADRLDWVFSSRRVRIKGKEYVGIGYSFRFKSKVNKAVEIELREPIAKTSARVIQQFWGDFLEEEPAFEHGETYRGRELDGYFVGMQPFFFQAGEDGAFLSYFDSIRFVRQANLGYAGRLSLKFDIPVELGNQVATPEKYWLISTGNFSKRWDAVREWTKVYDYLYRKFRKSRGIKEITPQPIIWSEAAGKEYRQIRERGLPRRAWLYRLADYLPRVAKLGIRQIFVNSIWECPASQPESLEAGMSTSPQQFKVSSLLGGERGLKHLCDRAHKYRIKIILWMTASDLSASSPLVRAHPEWVVKGTDGRPVCFEWIGSLWATSLCRGYASHLVSALKGIRQRTGADGLWQDCFHQFSRVRDFRRGRNSPQLEEMIALERQLQKNGYHDILLEGAGPFGLSSGGYYDPDSYLKWRDREYGLYNYVAETPIKNISRKMYYKVLANKGMIALLHHSWETAKAINEDGSFYRMLKEKVSQANRDYNSVYRLMEEKNLLGKNGVEWTNARNTNVILFAFRPFRYRAKEEFKVMDVTTGKPVKTQENGVLLTQSFHTYWAKEVSK